MAGLPSILNIWWFGWMTSGIGTTLIDAQGGNFTAGPSVMGTVTRTHRASGPYANIATPSNTTVQVASVTPGASASRSACQFRQGPTYDAFIATGTDITLCRHWHGLAFGAPTGNNSDTKPMSGSDSINVFCLFRFSTNAGDTVWQAVTSDGSGAQTVTPIPGATVVADTDYHLKIRVVYGDGVYFSVDGGAEIRVGTTQPLGTATLEPVHGITKFTTAGAETRSFRVLKTLVRVGTALGLS